VLPPVLVAVVVVLPVARAEALAARLGGPSYAVRELAGQDLVKMGRYALPVLRRGLAHRDPEVAERCRRLIPGAEEQAIRQRVAFLLETPPRPVPDDVPLARKFLAATGDTRDARELYVEIYVAHAAWLEEIARAGDQTGKVFWEGLDKLLAAGQEESFGDVENLENRKRPVTRAELALFLLMSADRTVKPQKSESFKRLSVDFFALPATRDHLNASRGGAALRRLLVSWLEGPRYVDPRGAEMRRLQLAYRAAGAGRVIEARPLVRKTAFDRTQLMPIRAAAFVALQDLGEESDLPALAALVRDNSNVGAWSPGDGNGIYTLVGDLALAACVRLTGHNLEDYGFPHADRIRAGVPDALYFGFADNKSRESARRKWSESADGRKLVTGGRR